MFALVFFRVSILALAGTVLSLFGCAGGDDGTVPSPEGPQGPAALPEPESPEPEGPGQAPVTGEPPTLSMIEAVQVGRRGQSIRITLDGADPNNDASGLIVELLDRGGTPIALVDRDADGEADDPERRVFFEYTSPPVSETETAFTAEAFLPAIFDEAPNAEAVRVRIVDSEGSTSAPVNGTIAIQPEVAAGATCDATYVFNRCPYGMGCAGEPAVCAEGTAPQIERLAYQITGETTEILIEGIEAEDDLKAIFIEFLDRTGEPVLLDLDADGSLESSSINIEVFGEALDGRFLIRFEQAPSFSDQVDQVIVTPVDDQDHVGEPVTERLGRPPVRGFNQSCDPFGFDVCTSGAACSPNDNGQGSRCRVIGPMQSELCANAPVVEPGESIPVTAAGDAFGASLWDPPSECAANTPLNRPEGAVILHLAEPAAGLRIRTDYDGTNFDTIVYLAEGCPQRIETALGCDDDSGVGVFSDLDVGFVPAGDYLIVVDSYDAEGGNFVLTVEVQ